MTEAEQKQIDAAANLLGSKRWRMNNLYKIKTKRKTLEIFHRNTAQQNYALTKTNKNLILKARQLGFTTECLIEFLDDTLTNANTSTAIIAHKQDKVVKMFEIVKRAYDNLPEYLKQRSSLDNRNEIYFPESDSKIYVTMDTRSETVNNLHVSEAHFIRNAEDMLAGTLESVPKDGRINLESTGNGVAGKFYEEWEDPQSEYTKHFYNWMWDDDYAEFSEKPIEQLLDEYHTLSLLFGTIPDIFTRFDLTKEQLVWYMDKVKRHKQLVVQEYPTTSLEAFLATGRNVFHMADLQSYKAIPPIERKYGDLFIWEKPLKDFRYVIGVDASEGRGGDNGVIEVINAYTGVQAAEFASNYTPPNKLAELAIEIGHYYNNAMLVPESNNHGHAVIQILRPRYWNLYRRESTDTLTGQKNEIIGWNTTGMTKPLLVDNLEEAVREHSTTINSEELLKEMKIFVQTDEGGKQGYGAEGTGHDDRVIAYGLAIQGIKDTPRQKKIESVVEKKMREYAERHGLPQEFKTIDELDFPTDSPVDNPVLNRHNRPNSGLKKQYSTF
jgi:hypothetical protein